MQNIKKKIILIITSLIIFLAIAILIMAGYLYIKKTNEQDEMKSFIGNYKLINNSIKNYNENYIPSEELTIDIDNMAHSNSKLVTSNYFNIIDEKNVIAYFGLIGDINSEDIEEQNEFYFSKICLEKKKNKLVQKECPTLVNDQELGISLENMRIEYEKITK